MATATKNNTISNDLKVINLAGKDISCYFGYSKLKNTILSEKSKIFLNHLLASL